MKFTHLHTHSHYSLLDGLPKIDLLLDRAKELKMNSIALTDHGVLYGAVEFYKKAKERNIKPIIGCEIYVALDKMTEKRPGIDDKRYHLVLLAKNKQGYENLVKLVTLAHLEGFYYKPRIDEELLKKYSKGLIALSACLQGKIPRLILAKRNNDAEKQIKKYQDIFGKDSFYLEIQSHPNIPDQKIVNDFLIDYSRKNNVPLVATNDIHYLLPEDADAHDILMSINTGSDINDPERLSLKASDFSMRSSEQMIKDFKDIPEAIENTQKIANECNFEFDLGKSIIPHFEVPNKKTPDDYLKELCLQGIEKRYGKNPNKEIIERLNYELSVIKEMGFSSYFLIVQDFVNWAKENRIIVGPGRGSAGGSIIAYALNITNIDPIKYNLIFERFLNPGRTSSLPDIDLDFTDRRRDEVIDYISEKYGEDKVAQIITFGTMASRAAIRDVGRALNYPYNFCDKIAKMIPFGLTLNQTLSGVQEFKDIYSSDQDAKKIIDFAKKLEGVVRHASTHACGVVISANPLNDIVPTQLSSQADKKVVVTQYEMHSVESLGLLKMDLLGLKNLTIIEDTLARIYKVHNKKVNIDELPENDPKAMKLLKKGDCIGIFQLESEGMRKYLKQLKPSSLEDIIAMVSLYRPGPMALISDYIENKYSKEEIEYIHPKLKPILEPTYGILVYQEQLLQIVRDLAGFSLSEADILRKAVGKKIKKLLMDQKDKFINGCKKNGINEGISIKVWHWIEPFAQYSFNKSHATAYATIAYQTAYLKSHFPVEFMSSLLTSEKADTERIGFLIGECKKMNIEVLPPDINESWINFSVVPNKQQIRFGLLAIKNVGHNIVEIIVKERKENGNYTSISDFINRINSRNLNKKSLESLVKAGAFDKLAERNQLLSNMDKILEYSRESQKSKSNGQLGLFDGSGAKNNHEINLPNSEPATKKDKLAWEKELLGLFVTSHPLEDFNFEKLKNFGKKIISISQLKESADKEIKQRKKVSMFRRKQVTIGGIINSTKKIITKIGKPMAFLDIEDLSEKIEVVVFPTIMEKEPNIYQENKIVLVSGRIDTRDNVPKLICEEIEEILEN